ncbi:MAG: aminoacyl-tRNA hydrolase [Nitriliruptorales bacterium]
MGTDRWLVVGLGNPEPEYAETRHNVGADVVRVLAGRHGRELSLNRRVRCATAEIRDGDLRLVLAKPIGYMNESGGPVQQVSAWYKMPAERIIVVHDDLDLEVGALRIKFGGGNAGHRGLRDIDRRLGTNAYHRVRVGIGRPPGRMDPRDHVLRRFDRREREEIDVTLEEAADAVLLLATEGLEPAQNRYHAR